MPTLNRIVVLGVLLEVLGGTLNAIVGAFAGMAGNLPPRGQPRRALASAPFRRGVHRAWVKAGSAGPALSRTAGFPS